MLTQQATQINPSLYVVEYVNRWERAHIPGPFTGWTSIEQFEGATLEEFLRDPVIAKSRQVVKHPSGLGSGQDEYSVFWHFKTPSGSYRTVMAKRAL